MPIPLSWRVETAPVAAAAFPPPPELAVLPPGEPHAATSRAAAARPERAVPRLSTRRGRRPACDEHKPGAGTVLVDRSGKTLYSPQQEASGKIACTGGCLSFWFPVTASSTHLASSGLPGNLGTIHRADDGKTQLTYNGKPLYTFRLDTAAGQAHGSNFIDSFSGTSFTWEVVAPSGEAGGAGSPAPSPSYGSGY